MSKNKKIFLGILTLLPVVFLIIYVFAMFFSVFGFMHMAQNGHQPSEEAIFGTFASVFVLFGFIFLSTIGLLIFYITHAARNPKFSDSDRLLWILICVFAGFIGFIIYWYIHIWKNTEITHEKLF